MRALARSCSLACIRHLLSLFLSFSPLSLVLPPVYCYICLYVMAVHHLRISLYSLPVPSLCCFFFSLRFCPVLLGCSFTIVFLCSHLPHPCLSEPPVGRACYCMSSLLPTFDEVASGDSCGTRTPRDVLCGGHFTDLQIIPQATAVEEKSDLPPSKLKGNS